MSKWLCLALLMILLCSCAGSGLARYDGKKYPPTSKCDVQVFHSIEWMEKFVNEDLSDEYSLIGMSSFSIHNNNTYYNENEMRQDCMKVGGDVILVVDEGVIDRENRTITQEKQKTKVATTTYTNRRNRTIGKSTTVYSEPEYETYNVTHTWSGYQIYVFKNLNE